MDVAQFKACVTCTATVDRDQVPSLSSSNGFKYPSFIYSNTNPSLIMFLTLILGTKVPRSLFLSGRRQYEGSNLKCGLWEAGSTIALMHLLTQHCQLDRSWQNIKFLPFHKPHIH
jgi:hypothetical protein